MTSRELVSKLRGKFEVYESRGLRVGMIWLAQENIQLLWKHPEVFDREVNAATQRAFPARWGYLWGASVNASPLVLPTHVALLQEGFGEVLLIDGSAAEPL